MKTKEQAKDEMKAMVTELMQLDPILAMLLFTDCHLLIDWIYDEECKLSLPSDVMRDTVARIKADKQQEEPEEEVETVVAAPFDLKKIY